MKKIGLILLGLIFVNTSMVFAMDETKVIVAVYEADWCQGCKIMKPALSKLEEAFSNEPIEFISFDLTNETTKIASAKMAAEKGLENIFSKYDSTGMVVLVNPETKKELAQFNYKNTYDEMVVLVTNVYHSVRREEKANKAKKSVSSRLDEGGDMMQKELDKELSY